MSSSSYEAILRLAVRDDSVRHRDQSRRGGRSGSSIRAGCRRPRRQADSKRTSRTAGSPLATAEQITRGKFVRKQSYGIIVALDADGRLDESSGEVEPLQCEHFRFPGRPRPAGWAGRTVASEPIPSGFTAKLDAAWSVGGIILDESGIPVEGVTVRPSVRFKKRPGDEQEWCRYDDQNRRRGKVAVRLRARIRRFCTRGDQSHQFQTQSAAPRADGVRHRTRQTSCSENHTGSRLVGRRQSDRYGRATDCGGHHPHKTCKRHPRNQNR